LDRFFGTGGGSKEEKVVAVRPQIELAVGDFCNSLDFFSGGSSPTLVAGLNGKYLRIMDIRTPDRPSQQGQVTKYSQNSQEGEPFRYCESRLYVFAHGKIGQHNALIPI